MKEKKMLLLFIILSELWWISLVLFYRQENFVYSAIILLLFLPLLIWKRLKIFKSKKKVVSTNERWLSFIFNIGLIVSMAAFRRTPTLKMFYFLMFYGVFILALYGWQDFRALKKLEAQGN